MLRSHLPQTAHRSAKSRAITSTAIGNQSERKTANFADPSAITSLDEQSGVLQNNVNIVHNKKHRNNNSGNDYSLGDNRQQKVNKSGIYS